MTDAMDIVHTRFLKQIKPVQNTVIVAKRPKGASVERWGELLNQLADDIAIQIGIRSVLLGVDKMSDIRALDEPTMEKFGWVRKDRVLIFKDDVMGDAAALLEEEE